MIHSDEFWGKNNQTCVFLTYYSGFYSLVILLQYKPEYMLIFYIHFIIFIFIDLVILHKKKKEKQNQWFFTVYLHIQAMDALLYPSVLLSNSTENR